MIPVNPTATYPTLANIDYSVYNWVMNSSISFAVDFFNTNAIYIDTENVIISGTDYDNWGLDDQYIIDCILTKLNLTEV